MSRILRLSLGALFLALPLASLQAQPRIFKTQAEEEAWLKTVKVTRWADPHSRPGTYEEYLRDLAKAGLLTEASFSASLAYRSPSPIYGYGRRLDVLVASNVYSSIKTRLEEYARDVEMEGWAVSLFVCSGGTPPEVRAFLQERYKKDRIAGCLLVGSLPVAWYELDDDFFHKHTQFPTDLYYMDLNGAFGDKDKDGKFDSHTATSAGDQRPDIFVGRLTARPLAGSWGSEASLLNNYFRKAHDYRRGILTAPNRALAFQDDDWYRMSTWQGKAYSTVVKVTDKYQTTAANYKKRLLEGYESVIVCSHSSPSVHTFKVPGSSTTRIYNYQMWASNPPCLFYNLFACSNCRYTSSRYYGGVYIFVKNKGLIAVGTTKTGSMLYFYDYYDALGRQACFGEAFRYWFARRYPYSLSDRRWFYGMTLLGDPTLRIDHSSLKLSAASIPPKGGKVSIAVDGRPDRAGKLYLVLTTLSGVRPGFELPGVRLPLNHDACMDTFVLLANTTAFQGAFGKLDGSGKGTAVFNLPCSLPKSVYGKTLFFSALFLTPGGTFLGATQPQGVILGI